MRETEYHPGSPEAVAHGCTCSPVLNRQGLGEPSPHGPLYHCDPSCPMHGVEQLRRAFDEEGDTLVRTPSDEDMVGTMSRGPGIGELELNAGEPWSDMDIGDLRHNAVSGITDVETAEFLCRPLSEVRAKAAELGLELVRKVQ